jgi:hypothetical protein
MNNYCVDLNLPLTIFKSDLSPIEFLKQNYNLKSHFQIDISNLNNELISFFDNLRLSVRLVEIFYRQPNAVGHIHSDTEVAGDYAKLNWVYGNGTMHWYKLSKNYTPTKLNTTDIKSYALYYNELDVELIHSQQVGQPSLVQVGCPHKVINSDTERFCISVVFETADTKERLTFQEACKLFSGSIKTDSIG